MPKPTELLPASLGARLELTNILLHGYYEAIDQGELLMSHASMESGSSAVVPNIEPASLAEQCRQAVDGVFAWAAPVYRVPRLLGQPLLIEHHRYDIEAGVPSIGYTNVLDGGSVRWVGRGYDTGISSDNHAAIAKAEQRLSTLAAEGAPGEMVAAFKVADPITRQPLMIHVSWIKPKAQEATRRALIWRTPRHVDTPTILSVYPDQDEPQLSLPPQEPPVTTLEEVIALLQQKHRPTA